MNFKWLLVIACLLMTACNTGFAQEADKTDKAKQDAEQKETEQDEAQEEDENPLDAIAKKIADARQEFMAAYRDASDEEKAEMRDKYPNGASYIDEVKKIAEENSKSDIAFDAYNWLLREGSSEEGVAEFATQKLIEDFIEDERMKSVCAMLSRAKPSAEIVKNLDKIISKSPHAEVKGLATYYKASYFEQLMSYQNSVDDPAFVEFFGEKSVEYIKNAKIDSEVMEGLYQSVMDDFADVEIARGRSTVKLGDMAKSALFEIQHLSVGCVAPDIVANDLDGTEFKLSDYRGKVVMLDFWGDW